MIFTFIFVNYVGQSSEINQTKNNLPPNFVSKAFLRLGVSVKLEEILAGYGERQFYLAKRVNHRAIQVSFYLNTNVLSISDEAASDLKNSDSFLGDQRLRSIAQLEYQGELVSKFHSPGALAHLKPIWRSEPKNPLVTFAWESVVRGFPAGYDGDYVRITLVRSSGKLYSLELKRNVSYAPSLVLLKRPKATDLAFKAIGKPIGELGEINGVLRYHLFHDTATKDTWKSTKKLELRVGYYFYFSPHRSCFVDAETGYVDIISKG